MSGQGEGQMASPTLVVHHEASADGHDRLGRMAALGQDPKWRKAPYLHSPAGDKYWVYIDGANHMSFTGRLGDLIGGIRRTGDDRPQPDARRSGTSSRVIEHVLGRLPEGMPTRRSTLSVRRHPKESHVGVEYERRTSHALAFTSSNPSLAPEGDAQPWPRSSPLSFTRSAISPRPPPTSLDAEARPADGLRSRAVLRARQDRTSGVGEDPSGRRTHLLRHARAVRSDEERDAGGHRRAQALGLQVHRRRRVLPEESDSCGLAWLRDDYSELAQKVQRLRRQIGYHNHSHELASFEGDKTALQMLLDELDKSVWWEIDTYWIQHGGADPIEWIRKVSGRIPACT
jgi:hypothetical protein